MMAKRHNSDVENIVSQFKEADYNAFIYILNASDYGVFQGRKKGSYVGFRKNLNIKFEPPKPYDSKLTFKDAIFDLKGSAIRALEKNTINGDNCKVLNHKYFIGAYSQIFMSRNRVRQRDEQAFSV